jgi:hypothetical protein
VIRDQRLQRRERARQPRDLRREVVEVGDPRAEVVDPVDVLGRPPAGQLRRDEVGIDAQRRAQALEQRQVGGGQLAVDRQRAEPARRVLGEVGGDRLDQARRADAIDALEVLPAAGRVEAGGREPADAVAGQLGKPASALEGARDQRRLVEQPRIQRARVAVRGQRRVGLVVERRAELVGERRAVRREVLAGAQQPLSQRQPLVARGGPAVAPVASSASTSSSAPRCCRSIARQ